MSVVPGLPVIGGSPSNPEYMWKVHEIAGKLNVSKMTVYRLIRERELNAIRLGRSFRVSNADLATYLRTARDAS